MHNIGCWLFLFVNVVLVAAANVAAVAVAVAASTTVAKAALVVAFAAVHQQLSKEEILEKAVAKLGQSVAASQVTPATMLAGAAPVLELNSEENCQGEILQNLQCLVVAPG